MMPGNNSQGVTRRRFIQSATTGSIAAAGLGSITGSGAADDHRGKEDYPYEFDTVIDMVEVGADPTGEEPVDPLIHEYADDHTLLYFPKGYYKINQYRNYTGDRGTFNLDEYIEYENFGLRGAGSGKSILVPRQGQGSDKYVRESGNESFQRLWFEIRLGRNIYVEGFTLDYTAERTGARFGITPTGGFVMRDVDVRGVHDNPAGALQFFILEEDAHGLVENVRLPDGATSPTEDFITNGIYVFGLHQGTITFKDCHVEGFTDNGLYASNPSPPGTVQVEGGLYRNNNISQVRLGTPDSYVKDTKVEVTDKIDTWYTVNMRGIRQADGSGVTVENCSVTMTADTPSNGGIVSNPRSGDLTIKNTRVYTGGSFYEPAVNMQSNSDTYYSGGLFAQNLVIVGDAPDGSALNIDGRTGNHLEELLVHQSGNDRDGVDATNSSGSLQNAWILATGDPLQLENSEFSQDRVFTIDLSD